MKANLCLATLVLCFCLQHLQGAEEDIYNPLELGLHWSADVSATAPDGKKYKGKASREITGTKEINGKTYFVMVTSIEGIPGFGKFTTYRRRQPDGIYAITESDPEKKEFLESATPFAVGKTWEVPAKQGKMIFRIEALENVTVGETKYENCYKVSYRSDTFNFSSYFYAAPHIGNVSEHMKAGGGTIIFTHTSLVKKKEGVVENPGKTSIGK